MCLLLLVLYIYKEGNGKQEFIRNSPIIPIKWRHDIDIQCHSKCITTKRILYNKGVWQGMYKACKASNDLFKNISISCNFIIMIIITLLILLLLYYWIVSGINNGTHLIESIRIEGKKKFRVSTFTFILKYV